MWGFVSGVAAGIVGAIIIAVSGSLWRKRHWVVGPGGSRATVRRMASSGVREAFFARSQYKTADYEPLRDIIEYLDTAKIRVRYVGLWMAQASEQHRLDEAVRALIRRGGEYHFVMLNPQMDDADMRAVSAALGIDDNEVRQRAAIALDKLIRLRESLPPEHKGRLHLAVHNHPLTMSVIEFDWDTSDHRCWLDIKLRSRGRADSLSMEIVQGSDNLIGRVMAAMDEPIKTATAV